MTIHNLYIFDRHCQCIYFQKWSHHKTTNVSGGGSISGTSQIGSGSRLGLTTSSSRHSSSSPAPSSVDQALPHSSLTKSEDRFQSHTQQSGLAAGSVISIEEEAKLVYGVILSLRNFVRKLSSSTDGFISYKTSTYRLHYYETPTGLKFVMNSDPNTESLQQELKQIYMQLYVEFVAKNGLMRFNDTRWEINSGFMQHLEGEGPAGTTAAPTTGASGVTHNATPVQGTISNELFRIAVDRFIRNLAVFD